ncbi:MAG TPA: hypothetical protein VHM91_19825 [Verrucomicrobiales bacterium]|nr:hypothetical protein [Verrucomicrobiales bacterium]
MKPADVFAMIVFSLLAVIGACVGRGRMLGALILDTLGLTDLLKEKDLGGDALKTGGWVVAGVSLLIVLFAAFRNRPALPPIPR